MDIRIAQSADLDAWADLRLALWPWNEREDLLQGSRVMLDNAHEVAFIAWQDDQPIGLIEGQIRRGDDAQLYGHVEGWYVVDAARGKGVGGKLMDALSQWFLHHHIRTLFSDTIPDYPLSPAAHRAAGFEEVDRIIIFRKRLDTDTNR
ncbi:GNAT family N-acetyltransferase [Saccharospirillum mangrovi]|uniref:GNAT family N-acetyltransferase n=1 Tax=Saccharospirillum mangrovi TaxID=2161747 RepID=UPI000D3D307F|nr:GNAT family N-acetyltransferase [Saccharospirillum mangrovi]